MYVFVLRIVVKNEVIFRQILKFNILNKYFVHKTQQILTYYP